MKKTKLTALLLSLVMALAFVPFLGVVNLITASAATDDEKVYESFYYFSDNKNCQNYYDNMMCPIIKEYGQSVNSTINTTLYDWSSNYATNFSDYFRNVSYGEISNSLIVFELSQGLDEFELDWSEIYFFDDYICGSDILYEIFKTFKGNGCKIMFICDTDETRFNNQGHNKFLDYVDIHINTDMLTLIMNTALYWIERDGGVTGWTFILDKNSSGHTANLLEEDLPFRKLNKTDEYLINYLCNVSDVNKSNFIDEPERYYLLEVLGNLVVNIFIQDSGEMYFCNFSDCTTEYYENPYFGSESHTLADMLLQVDLNPNKTCAFGMAETFADIFILEDWVDSLIEFQNYTGDFTNMYMPIYNLNSSGDYLSALYPAADYVKYNINEAGKGIYDFYTGDDFKNIFYDFVFGNDLTVYDNWSGRCAVTYKTIEPGSGWLLEDIQIADPSCWYVYPDREDYVE